MTRFKTLEAAMVAIKHIVDLRDDVQFSAMAEAVCPYLYRVDASDLLDAIHIRTRFGVFTFSTPTGTWFHNGVPLSGIRPKTIALRLRIAEAAADSKITAGGI